MGIDKHIAQQEFAGQVIALLNDFDGLKKRMNPYSAYPKQRAEQGITQELNALTARYGTLRELKRRTRCVI